MKKLEIVCLLLILTGLLFKILHWPGGDIILIMAVGILGLIYFLTAYILFNNIKLRDLFRSRAKIDNPSMIKTIVFIVSGIALSIIIHGLLFSVMIWPGSLFMLLIGLSSGLICLLFIVFKYLRGDKSYRWALYRLVPFVLITGIFCVYPAVWIDYHYDFDHKSRDLLREIQSNPNDTSLDNQFRNRMDFYMDSCNNAANQE